MKKIRTMLYGALAMLVASMTTTPLIAGSSDIAGPYVAVQGVSLGVEFDGSYTDSDSVVTKGSGGKIAQVAGIEIGYSIPASDTFLIGIGASYYPGEADLAKADDAADAADITVKADEFYTFFVQPTISVTDNSAVFLKYGQSKADLKVSGDFTGTASNELDGETFALGTMTIFPTGLFMKTEAGFTEYDDISVNDIGTAADDDSAKGDVKATPEAAFGAVTIGFKF